MPGNIQHPASGAEQGDSSWSRTVCSPDTRRVPTIDAIGRPGVGCGWGAAASTLKLGLRTAERLEIARESLLSTYRIASGCMVYGYPVPSHLLATPYPTPIRQLANMGRMPENHAWLMGAGHRRPTLNLNIQHRTSNIQHRIAAESRKPCQSRPKPPPRESRPTSAPSYGAARK